MFGNAWLWLAGLWLLLEMRPQPRPDAITRTATPLDWGRPGVAVPSIRDVLRF